MGIANTIQFYGFLCHSLIKYSAKQPWNHFFSSNSQLNSVASRILHNYPHLDAKVLEHPLLPNGFPSRAVHGCMGLHLYVHPPYLFTSQPSPLSFSLYLA